MCFRLLFCMEVTLLIRNGHGDERFFGFDIKNEIDMYICAHKGSEKMNFSAGNAFYFWFYYFGRVSGAER